MRERDRDRSERSDDRAAHARELAAMHARQTPEARSNLEAFALLVGAGVAPEAAMASIHPQRGS